MVKYRMVLLSGQLEGDHPEMIAKKFDEASKNYDWETTMVIDPVRYGSYLQQKAGKTMSDIDMLLKRLELIPQLDEIAMLPDWNKAWASTAEHAVAQATGIKITYL